MKNKVISPLGILMMIHYHCYPGSFEGGLPSPAGKEMGKKLCKLGLLTLWGHPDESDYAITDRGTAYVESLCNLPFPVARTVWVTPGADD